MQKRILTLLLSIVMVISMVPLQAFAQEEVPEISQDTTAPEEETLAPEIPEETLPTEAETLPPETPAEEPLPTETETLPQEASEEEPETMVEETEPAFESQIQPWSASGDCSAEDSWNSTNDVSWSLNDNGVLTISGTGQMKNYSESNAAPWFSERLSIKQVIINPGVTYIGNYAFYYCVNLENVTIPGTVKTVGSSAFSKCTALTSVVIPDGVAQLYNYVFSGCTALTQVSLPVLPKSAAMCFITVAHCPGSRSPIP